MPHGVTDDAGPVASPLRLRHLARRYRRIPPAYRRPLWRDPDVAQQLARHGCAVTPPLLAPDTHAALLEACDRWREAQPDPADGTFSSSFTPVPTAASTRARDAIEAWLLPALEGLVQPGRAVLQPSVFQVKPVGPASGVRAHQDSFLVDERASYSVFAWVALTDVTLDDGPLFVLPGSHRWARRLRVHTASDDFAGLHDVLEAHGRAIEVRAGQAVLFDAATVHGSLPNRGRAVRLAASGIVRPADAPLTVPAPVDAHRPAATDLYRPDPGRAADGTIRPLTDGSWLGRVPLEHLEVSARGLEAWCRAVDRHQRRAPGTAPGGRSDGRRGPAADSPARAATGTIAARSRAGR